jgi:hypothetical protein
MRDGFVTIVGKEGPSRLFAGLVPTMVLRDIPFAALYLIFYTDAQRYWPVDAQQSTALLTGIFWSFHKFARLIFESCKLVDYRCDDGKIIVNLGCHLLTG